MKNAICQVEQSAGPEIAGQRELFVESKGTYTEADRLALYRATKAGQIKRAAVPGQRGVFYARQDFRAWFAGAEGRDRPVTEVVKEAPESQVLVKAPVAEIIVDEVVPAAEVAGGDSAMALLPAPAQPALALVADGPPEGQEFEVLDAVVRKGIGAFVEVGAALKKIGDGELFKEAGFKTFGAYLADRVITRGYASRLIAASRICTDLDTMLPNGNIRPRAEAQVRPLTRLDDPALQGKAWCMAVERSDRSQPTAKTVAAVVREMLGTADSPPPEKPDVKGAFQRLAEAVAAGRPHHELAGMLAEFGKLIGMPTSFSRPPPTHRPAIRNERDVRSNNKQIP